MSVVPRVTGRYALEPMVETIAAFRAVLLAPTPEIGLAGRALASSALICAAGVIFFRYREPVFADVV